MAGRTPSRQSTPLRGVHARKKTPDRQSRRSTRASSQGSHGYLERSPAPPVPPVPNTALVQPLDCEALAREWVAKHQARDPVFSSPTITRHFEQLIKCDIQPYTHCQPQFFPTVAMKFGLQRWIPVELPRKGSRGPTCISNGIVNKTCHRTAIPAFAYVHTEGICENAKQKGYPTLMVRWDINNKGQLHSQACWSCATHGESRCGLNAMRPLSPIDIASPPSTNQSPKVSAVPPIQSPRTSDAADLPLPRPKRQQTGSDFTRPDVFDDSKPAQTVEQLVLPGTQTLPLSTGNETTHSSDVRSDIQGGFPQESREGIRSLFLSSGTALGAVAQADSAKTSLPVPLRGWEAYLAKFMPQGPAVAPPPLVIPSTPTLPSPTPHAYADSRTHLLPSVSAAAEILHPISKDSLSITDGVVRFKEELRKVVATPVESALAHLESCRQSQRDTNNVVEQAFGWFEKVRAAAEHDRAAIDGVRKDRDEIATTLKDLDSRFVKLAQEHALQGAEIKSLNKQYAFVQDHLTAARREQTAVEKRMGEAYKEKKEAEEQMAKSLRDAEEMRMTARRAIAQRDEAITIRKEAEAAITDAHLHISELRSTLQERSGVITQLEAELQELRSTRPMVNHPQEDSELIASPKMESAPIPLRAVAEGTDALLKDKAVGEPISSVTPLEVTRPSGSQGAALQPEDTHQQGLIGDVSSHSNEEDLPQETQTELENQLSAEDLDKLLSESIDLHALTENPQLVSNQADSQTDRAPHLATEHSAADNLDATTMPSFPGTFR